MGAVPDGLQWDYLTDRDTASDWLAGCLQGGTLGLVLGAGTSSGVGLPDWVTLVRRIRHAAGFGSDEISGTASADELQALAEEVEREKFSRDPVAFAAIVKKALYQEMPRLDSSILRHELLSALAALVGGRSRGSVRRIVTLNYDSLLEWYLSLCGVVPRVIVKAPGLEGSEDVRIYHPHGFLPHDQLKLVDGVPIVIGFKEIDGRLGANGDPWNDTLRHFFMTGVALFVGLSDRTFDDRALSPVLRVTANAVMSRRPVGFWLLPVSKREDLTRRMLDKGVVPIFLNDRAAVSDFLLQICQKAAFRQRTLMAEFE